MSDQLAKDRLCVADNSEENRVDLSYFSGVDINLDDFGSTGYDPVSIALGEALAEGRAYG